jgi:hypothetical protein
MLSFSSQVTHADFSCNALKPHVWESYEKTCTSWICNQPMWMQLILLMLTHSHTMILIYLLMMKALLLHTPLLLLTSTPGIANWVMSAQIWSYIWLRKVLSLVWKSRDQSYHCSHASLASRESRHVKR